MKKLKQLFLLLTLSCASTASWAALDTVTIGEDATDGGDTAPYGKYFHYSTTQQIYSAEEMGNKAGTISAIAFKVATEGSFTPTSIKIYLGHKASSTFSSATDYMTSSNLTLVYSGSPTLGSTAGWEKLDFNKNDGVFEYNGTDNLVVVVCKSSTSSSGTLKYNYTTTNNRLLSRSSDNIAECADVGNTANTYSKATTRPSVKFWIDHTSEMEVEEGVAYTRTTDKPLSKVTYTRSFSSDRVGKYQAWFLPFDHTITEADQAKFDFFKINMIANAGEAEAPESDDVYIYLNTMAAGATLKGNMPYVYRPKEAVTNYTFVSENVALLAKNDAALLQTSTTKATYDFYGTYANTTATTESPFYYINIKGQVSYGTTVTVGPYRWILRATTKDGITYARQLTFVEGETTALPSVADDKGTANSEVYDLQGRKVATPAKGLYVVNGRKVLVK